MDDEVEYGKYLGPSITTEQRQAISDGSFNGMNFGDYWVINSVKWRIIGFDIPRKLCETGREMAISKARRYGLCSGDAKLFDIGCKMCRHYQYNIANNRSKCINACSKHFGKHMNDADFCEEWEDEKSHARIRPADKEDINE